MMLRLDAFCLSLSIVVLIIIIYLGNYIRKKYRILKMVSKFDGPQIESSIMGHGTIYQKAGNNLRLLMKQFSEKYYPHYQIRIFHEVAVVILSPEDAEKILSTKNHSSKSDIYLILKRWLVDGLLLSKGKKWIERRRMITPAFHFAILKQFLTVFNEETERFVGHLSKRLLVDVDIFPLCTEFTLYTMTETSMGLKLDINDADQAKYRDAICSIGKIFIQKITNPFCYVPGLYHLLPSNWKEIGVLKTLHGFTRRIIHNKMKNFKPFSMNFDQIEDDTLRMNKKKRKLAMLDILLQAKHDGQNIGNQGICEEVDTFMFAGHDTTAASLSFTLMLLGSHPTIQEQVYHEIKSVLGEELKKPTYNELQELHLLERCVKESLRLYPSVHSISRFADEDIVLHSGKVVPKDARVYISIIDIHMNPKFYPKPNKFDPDRFLPENCQNRHPYAYIPFSAGPRNCIGQKFAMLEIKAFLVGVIQRFKITSKDRFET